VAEIIGLSLGPVQEFIASARRTRDLWFGSHVLSEVSKAAALHLLNSGATLIFPNPSAPSELSPDSGFNAANVVLARVDAGDAKGLALGALEAARSRLLGVFDTLPRPTGLDVGTARAQVADLLEGYAAVAPLEAGFRSARARVMALLAARKATRDFSAVAWGRDGVRKCSLDGLRESVTGSVANAERFGLRANESLCGVGWLKRVGSQGRQVFASVPRIAASSVETPANRPLIEAYFEALNRLRGDDEAFEVSGAALFEDRLLEVMGREDLVPRAQASLRALMQRLGVAEPESYYALLVADGDGMGALIESLDEDGQRRLSRSLAGFSSDAARIVAVARG
jgi:CRISPR-associated protein Cmr2